MQDKSSLFLLGEFIWGHIAQLEMKASCNSIVCVYIIINIVFVGMFSMSNGKNSAEKKALRIILFYTISSPQCKALILQ